MGLITEFDGSIEGYEAVPLTLPAGVGATLSQSGAVLRRRAPRPSRRAVLYVHAVDDDFAAADQVSWYTDRGFHFYAADLRSVGSDRPSAADRVPEDRPSPHRNGTPESLPAAAGLRAAEGNGTDPHPDARPEAGDLAQARTAIAQAGAGDATEAQPGSPLDGNGLGGAAFVDVAEPAPWDTATFDAIRFDQAVLDREAFRWAVQRGHGRHRIVPAQRAADRAGADAAAAGGAVQPAARAEVSAVGALTGQHAAGQHRSLPADVSKAAEELGECFDCLDAAHDHLRDQEAIDTIVVAAHSAGALVAALWVHARRGVRPVDALILANPVLEGRSWFARMRIAREEHAAGRRASPLLTSARRRVRRGLDIACPVLVMCPAGGEVQGGGRRFGARFRFGDRAPARLGAHVTWLSMEAGLPGQPLSSGAESRRYFEELTRWLGAYLSGQIRDQLL